MRIFVDMDGTLARFHDEVGYLERMFEKGFLVDYNLFSRQFRQSMILLVIRKTVSYSFYRQQ